MYKRQVYTVTVEDDAGFAQSFDIGHRFANRLDVYIHPATAENGNGTVTVAGALYDAETSSLTHDRVVLCHEKGCTLTAVPEAGYRFEGWYTTDGYTQRLSSSTTYLYTPASNDASIFPKFTVNTRPLDDEGTANCYIVPSPGTYSFAAQKVSGTDVTGIAKVDWIWATRVEGSETNELISDLTYADGRISFKASTRKGNVLVAAFNDADEILWSWHIWMTDDPRTDEMRYAGGMTFLDRNLGAVNAVPGSANSAGVLYQWGRKDPIAGGHGEEDIYTSGTDWSLAREATVMNTGYEWKINYTKSDRTMDYATANPTVMLGDYQSGTWLATADNELWGAVKTEYDPCPPGYRVPEIDFGVDFTTNYSCLLYTSPSPRD